MRTCCVSMSMRYDCGSSSCHICLISLQLAVHTANKGLHKGAPNTPEIMEQWADLTNFPKTGGFNRYKGFSTSVNNCWPASQTNFVPSQRGQSINRVKISLLIEYIDSQTPTDATVDESRPAHEGTAYILSYSPT